MTPELKARIDHHTKELAAALWQLDHPEEGIHCSHTSEYRYKSYQDAEEEIVILTGRTTSHSTHKKLVHRQEFELPLLQERGLEARIWFCNKDYILRQEPTQICLTT